MNDFKAERDTLIEDITILKANNERLMRRNEKLEDYLHIRGESSTTYKYEHDVINELEELEDEYKINYKNEIDEIRKVYRKAKSFDKLVNFYPQKDEIPSDEFFMMMGYIIEGYKDELKEVHSKAKAFDELVEYKDDITKVKEISLTHATEEPFNSDMYSVHSLVDNLLDVINEYEERADNET